MGMVQTKCSGFFGTSLSLSDDKDNGGQNEIAACSEKVDKHYLKVPKGQLISKQNCRAVFSPKKRTKRTRYYLLTFTIGKISSFCPGQHQAAFLTLIISHKLTQSLQNLRKYLFRHAKGKSLVNFYIVNALGQNLANSESCPILRLL